MIKTIYNVGKILKDVEEYEDYFQPWQNPKVTKVLCAVYENKQFMGVEVEDFSKTHLYRYLCRKYPSRGCPLMPSLAYYIASKEDEQIINNSKFIDKVQRSISQNKAILLPYLPNVYFSNDGFRNIDNDILNSIVSKALSAVGDSYFFTLKFFVDGTEKYLGDIEECKQILMSDAYNGYFQTKTANFKAENKICAITNELSAEVWGKISTLGFTVNDQAFIRGGFDANEAYKMFPVSPEAVRIIEGGKRVVFDKIRKQFGTMNYLVLPHFLNDDIPFQKRVLRSLFRAAEENNKSTSFNAQLQFIGYNEQLIKEIVADKEGLGQASVYYDIFYYEEQQSQFSIKLHVSDVLPSRFERILNIKTYIETKYQKLTNRIFKKGKKEEVSSFYINLNTIKPFFSKTSVATKKTTLHPYFFKIIEAIFQDTKLNEQQILKAFLGEIIIAYKQQDEYAFAQMTKETIVLYHFFHYLNLFQHQSTLPPIMETNPTVALAPRDFVAEHAHFFDNTTKQAAFYFGCMVEILLSKQQSKIGNAPFKKYLNGLSMDIATMRKVHQKWQDKVNQYEDTIKKEEWDFIKKVEPGVCAGLIDTASNKVSKTDLSYAFITGMVIQRSYKSASYNKEKKND
jgi:CRISPR-associated Csh1 family protein